MVYCVLQSFIVSTYEPLIFMKNKDVLNTAAALLAKSIFKQQKKRKGCNHRASAKRRKYLTIFAR